MRDPTAEESFRRSIEGGRADDDDDKDDDDEIDTSKEDVSSNETKTCDNEGRGISTSIILLLLLFDDDDDNDDDETGNRVASKPPHRIKPEAITRLASSSVFTDTLMGLNSLNDDDITPGKEEEEEEEEEGENLFNKSRIESSSQLTDHMEMHNDAELELLLLLL